MGYILVKTYDNEQDALVEKSAQVQRGNAAELKVSESVTEYDCTEEPSKRVWDKDGSPTLYTLIISGD
mgnify:CR=1 FL=1